MDKNTQRALVPMYHVIEKSDEELYRELGLLKLAIAEDAEGSDKFGMEVEYTAEAFGPFDGLVAVGRAYFKRVSRRAYSIVCGDDPEDTPEREKIRGAFQGQKEIVAATLAAALVSTLGTAPALATIIGALVVKICLGPAADMAYENMCRVWKDNLPEVPQ